MSEANAEAILYVSDLRRSTRFYEAVLGFAFEGYFTADNALVMDQDAQGEFACATLRARGLTVNLVPADPAGLGVGAGVGHVVNVPELDALHAAVQAAGAEPSAIEEQPWGFREFTVSDPDGYTWTLRTKTDARGDQAAARGRGEITGYVSAGDFQKAAQEQNLTVQEYLDKVWGTDTATLSDFSEGVFTQAARFGVFDRPVRRVVEIGTGVGMHVPTVTRRCQPESYESYEPERGWAAWLTREYGVVSHDCDGVSLRQTATASVDLVHAHAVFVALLFLTSVQYFREITRILRPGGHAVFDILSVASMPEEAVDAWLASEWRWPVVLNKDHVAGFFLRRGCAFVGDFLVPAFDEQGVCQTNYLIFKKL